MHLVDYSVVLIYILVLILTGIRTRHSSANISDYIRMGNKSTWWLTGFSLFMASFSAATFTGIAGQAYIAGWSLMITPLCNALGFFIQAAFFAPLLRRTRAITPMDAVKARFGPAAEQVKVYAGTLGSFFYAGFFLLGFATFASGLFTIPMWIVVVLMGVVVIFYSVSGGSWSVQINDSLQALILIPVTVAFTIICMIKVGGVSGLFEGIEAAGLSKDYAWIKPHDYVYSSPLAVRKGNFTLLWAIASVFNGMIMAVNIGSCYRYLSLKDESGSRKAALLAGCLIIFGCLIWFIPPIVGRLYFSEEINAVQGIENPADAAYAITAMKMLPPGLLGLIFVCMMGATLSSMDSFLTGTAGFIVRNLYQPLKHTLGKDEDSPRRILLITKWVNFGLGVWAIFMAFVLNQVSGEGGMFEVMQTIITVIGAPSSLPFALSLVYKRIPLWGLFAGIGIGMIASITLLVLRSKGIRIEWGYEVFIMTGACILPTLISSIWWKQTSPTFRHRVEAFFSMIHRPINVAEEVGEDADKQLLRTVSVTVLSMASLVLLLLFWCISRTDIYAVLGIAGFLFTIGGMMRWLSKKIT